MTTRTLILQESEIISLLGILDHYRLRVVIMTNSLSNTLIDDIDSLKENIIFQSNRELDIKEQLNP